MKFNHVLYEKPPFNFISSMKIFKKGNDLVNNPLFFIISFINIGKIVYFQLDQDSIIQLQFGTKNSFYNNYQYISQCYRR